MFLLHVGRVLPDYTVSYPIIHLGIDSATEYEGCPESIKLY